MRLLPPSSWLPRALCIAGVLLGGCVVSPQPEPPAIDSSLLSIESTATATKLVGAPGAVTPGGGLLAQLDLDTTAAQTSGTVAADGSFAVPLSGTLSDEYRLQALLGGLRSAPLDVTGIKGISFGGDALAVVMRPLADCLVLTPALEVDFPTSSPVSISLSSSVTVTMSNGCTSDVTVGKFSLRAGSPGFSVSPATGPLVVPVGGKASFTVTFSPKAGGSTDDVLFVEIDAPVKTRRPLTLRGFVP